MSGVWAWFGGSAAQKKKDSPKNAIIGLRSQLEMLQKREKHLMAQMEEQDAIARKNVNTNKTGKLLLTDGTPPTRADTQVVSREGRIAEEEGARAQPRADDIANWDVGTTNQCYRVS